MNEMIAFYKQNPLAGKSNGGYAKKDEIIAPECHCYDNFNCCDCGGNDCGCRYCFSCNACDKCLSKE